LFVRGYSKRDRRVEHIQTRLFLPLAVLAAATWVCPVSADEPQHGDGRRVSKDGKAKFTFGKWRLLFEGVPCDSAGARVAFQYPVKNGSGKSDSSFDGVKVSQRMEANEITVEEFRFKLLGKAEKLAFKDRTYTVTDKEQTIIIGRDGMTRLADKK
jgi:hypothetical protein